MSFVIKKPAPAGISTKKVPCKRCHSVFFVKCSKENGDFKFDFDIFFLSPFAEAVMKWKIDNPGKRLSIKDQPWHRRVFSAITGRIRV